ncbi:hypothetical protein SH2C18_17180 [Clostridium sediminicola]|uniref:hypothetical protein n=1 Tax=Clostridium sediminicola TaxID=3114879 RepID=UPI0031F1F134
MNNKNCCKTEINHILYLTPPAIEITNIEHKFKTKPKIIFSTDKDKETIIKGIIEKKIKYKDFNNNDKEIVDDIPFEDKISCCYTDTKKYTIDSIEISELCRKLSGTDTIGGRTVFGTLLEKISVKIAFSKL